MKIFCTPPFFPRKPVAASFRSEDELLPPPGPRPHTSTYIRLLRTASRPPASCSYRLLCPGSYAKSTAIVYIYSQNTICAWQRLAQENQTGQDLSPSRPTPHTHPHPPVPLSLLSAKLGYLVWVIYASSGVLLPPLKYPMRFVDMCAERL